MFHHKISTKDCFTGSRHRLCCILDWQAKPSVRPGGRRMWSCMLRDPVVNKKRTGTLSCMASAGARAYKGGLFRSSKKEPECHSGTTETLCMLE
jgi:hypothetical protein